MKVGDKVYCKRVMTSSCYNDNDGDIIFMKGCSYDVVSIGIESCNIHSLTMGDSYITNSVAFKNYFYTKQDLRKIKLLKLNKI